MTPSFIGLVASGLLNLVAVVIFLINIETISATALVQVILLLAISIGIHSLQHFQQEVHYGFNPLEGKWVPASQ